MNGKIFFEDEEALARFLKAFTGSTALFEVNFHGGNTTNGGYVLEFTGGF